MRVAILFALCLTVAAAAAHAESRGIWLCEDEIAALPTNTAAYTRVLNTAGVADYNCPDVSE